MIAQWFRRRIDRRRRLVLASLARQADQTGADLARSTGLGPAWLYPILIVAEERGAIRSAWDGSTPRRMRYRITAIGSRELEAIRGRS